MELPYGVSKWSTPKNSLNVKNHFQNPMSFNCTYIQWVHAFYGPLVQVSKHLATTLKKRLRVAYPLFEGFFGQFPLSSQYFSGFFLCYNILVNIQFQFRSPKATVRYIVDICLPFSLKLLSTALIPIRTRKQMLCKSLR